MKIKIGPLFYTVSECEYLGKFVGDISDNDCTINILKNLPKQVKDVTILHEVLHGILFQAGIKHNEQIIEALSHGVYAFLRDNPKLIKSFSERKNT